jgi:putative addiction module component (TIGR02574 family)
MEDCYIPASANGGDLGPVAEQGGRSAVRVGSSDRAEIAASLIASLDPQNDHDVDAAWALEIKQRIESIDKGEVQLVPADEVFQAMRERLNG